LFVLDDVSQATDGAAAAARSEGFHVSGVWTREVPSTAEPVKGQSLAAFARAQAGEFWSEADGRLTAGDATVRCRCCIANLR